MRIQTVYLRLHSTFKKIGIVFVFLTKQCKKVFFCLTQTDEREQK